MVDFQYNVMHIFLSYKKPDFVKLLNPIDFYINTLLIINRIFYIKLFKRINSNPFINIEISTKNSPIPVLLFS